VSHYRVLRTWPPAVPSLEIETVTETTSRETLGFQTEVRQLLQLMIHSLYSNKEIFLRELISNASDAADKLRFEAIATPDLLEDAPELEIHITLDAAAGTVTVSDNGIGMSREELIENLGTIARSGTADFLQQMTGDERKDARLIGQFGVGFYSAFIVAKEVEVISRKAALGAADAVRWQSDGQGEFTIDATEKAARGTDVVLHLKDDERDFLDAFRLESLIRKYSDHIAFPVHLDDKGNDDGPHSVNSATALWRRPRTEVEDEEYREFYKSLAHDFTDPLAWSHNRVEGKREYTSLLYIPASAPFDFWNREAPKGLKLYVQRVFIMDDAEQFLPLYLRFVKGVIDSADLPLNVSRELLQRNPETDAIRGALVRRVLDMLNKMAGNEPDDYATFWAEFGQALKEGVIEDKQNSDKLLKLLRFASTTSDSAAQNHSLDDYAGRMAEGQNKIYYILGESWETAKSSPHLEQLREKGIEVLLLSDRIDPWLVDHLAEYDDMSFADVSRGQLPLPEGDGEITQEAINEEHKGLLKKIKRSLGDRVEAVNVSQRLVDSPACVVTAEQDLTPQLRRMLEASGQTLPEAKPILEVNVDHPLLIRVAAETGDEQFEELTKIVLDHALLAEGAQLDNPADYVRRVNQLILDLDKTS
jgi:molecular chaperone HtpG